MMKFAFKPAVCYPVGQKPYGVATADFNGDGKPDIVATNYRDGTVSVLLGNGDGSFATQVTYKVGSNPQGVATADFNRDAQPDIVATNYRNSTVSVLLGHGDGSFAAKVSYLVGSAPWGVAAADFNGDTKLDLVTANSGTGSTVSVLLGHGDGTFSQQVTYQVGLGPSGVAVADLDADGNPDIVTANSNANNISILLGHGDRSFATQINYPVGSSPQGVATADFNGDAKLDIVVTNRYSGTISILLGQEDGTFSQQVPYPVGSGPCGVATADFNGDAKLDIVVTNQYSDTISILLGHGNGTFAQQATYPAGPSPYGVAIADFNGDGKPDIVVTNQNKDTFSVLINDTPTPIPTTTATSSESATLAPIVTDTMTLTQSTATASATSILTTTPIPVLILRHIIHNPNHQEWAQIKTVGNARTAVLSRDNTLVAITSNEKITLLNVKDPKNPTVISTIDIANSINSVFSSNGKRLYVAGGDQGLKIIDLSHPAAPVIQSSPFARPVHCIVLSPEHTVAYLCTVLQNTLSSVAKMRPLATENTSTLVLANLENPIDLQTMGSVSMPGLKSVTPTSSLALLSNGLQGLSIVRLGNSSYLDVIAQFNTSGSVNDAVFSADGHTVYVAASDGLKVLQFNQDDPNNTRLILLETIKTPGIPNSLYLDVNATTLFLADGTGGTAVFDIQTHAPYPLYQSTIDTLGKTGNVVPSDDGQVLYVADGQGGLRVMRLVPEEPESTRFLKEQIALIASIVGGISLIVISSMAAYMKKGLVKNIIYKKEYTKEEETVNYAAPADYEHIPFDRKSREITRVMVKEVRALQEIEGRAGMACCLPQYFIDALQRETLPSGDSLPSWLRYNPTSNRVVASDQLKASDVGRSVIVQIVARDNEILEEFRLTVVDEGSQCRAADPSDVHLHEVSTESIEASSTEEQASYFMAHVQHHNPLLNDGQCFQLFQIAHTHAGMQGIDALIEIGEHPETYARFQALRSQIGDERAVALYLEAESGASSASPTTPDSPISSDLHSSLFVVLGLIEHKGVIQYLWHQQIRPIASDTLVAWVNLIPAPTVTGSTALGWTGLHFALSSAVYFKSNSLLAIAAQSASFGIKEMLIEQRAIHSRSQAEHFGECVQTHYPLFMAQALSSVLSAWSSLAIAPIRLPHVLAGATLQTSLTALQCCGSKEDPTEITLTQQMLPYLIDLGILGTLILKTPIYAPAGVITHYGFMTLSAVAVADQVSKIALSWVPDEVFRALEQPFTWLLGTEGGHEVGDVSLDTFLHERVFAEASAQTQPNALPYCEIDEMRCEMSWNISLVEPDLVLLTDLC